MHYVVLYPQNGDRIETIDSVTSLHPMYTLLANQPISDGEATDHCQKVTSQDGGLPELIVARSCLTSHSEAASL